MSEYIFQYDGWAKDMSKATKRWNFDLYKHLKPIMHARKNEEIVRCQNCEFMNDVTNNATNTVQRMYWCELYECPTDYNGFCHRAKKKVIASAKDVINSHEYDALSENEKLHAIAKAITEQAPPLSPERKAHLRELLMPQTQHDTN